MSRRPEPMLAVLSAMLTLAIAYEVFAPLPAYSVPGGRSTALPALVPLPPPFSPPAENLFAAVSDRPLFDPQRRKSITPAIAGKSAPPPPPKLSLVGVIIDTDRRLAMVKASDGVLASSVGVGAEIGGWTVKAIEPDRMVLEAGTAEQEIRLDANKVPATASVQTVAHPAAPIDDTRASPPNVVEPQSTQ